jgi:hypothetical protein
MAEVAGVAAVPVVVVDMVAAAVADMAVAECRPIPD